MKQDERWQLIDSLIDGSIADADMLRIEAELIVDPQVRQQYYRRLQLDLLLERESAIASEDSRKESGSFTYVGRRTILSSVLLGSLVALAASVLLIVSVLSVNREPSSLGEESVVRSVSEPSASGFAVLSGQDRAVWDGQSLREGDLIPSGQLHLKAGRIHIELFSGVDLVVEGDSLFSVDSPMQVTMVRGTGRARVPEPAQGFRITTQSGDIVDLGTEFSVDVNDSGADVHVVDGEVELRPQQSDVVRIAAGSSRRLGNGPANAGSVTEATSSIPNIVGPIEFQALLRHKRALRMSSWEDEQRQIQTDSRMVAYYRFQSNLAQPRQLDNLAGSGDDAASDATVVAAISSSDRWGRAHSALDFSRVGSRVRVDVPGEYRGLTLLCWVKINSLDRQFNSLFLTDGHEDGEPHWQLLDDGRIFFSVKVPSPEDAKFVQPVFYSPKVWDASIAGRWIMLAVTYDVDNQMVTHYFNGEPISSEPIPLDMLVASIRIGAASICNWSEPMYRTDPQFILRNLNGSMDEFAMFSGALAADEILDFYSVGQSE